MSVFAALGAAATIIQFIKYSIKLSNESIMIYKGRHQFSDLLSITRSFNEENQSFIENSLQILTRERSFSWESQSNASRPRMNSWSLSLGSQWSRIRRVKGILSGVLPRQGGKKKIF
jgi:hypothetical protein